MRMGNYRVPNKRDAVNPAIACFCSMAAISDAGSYPGRYLRCGLTKPSVFRLAAVNDRRETRFMMHEISAGKRQLEAFDTNLG